MKPQPFSINYEKLRLIPVESAVSTFVACFPIFQAVWHSNCFFSSRRSLGAAKKQEVRRTEADGDDRNSFPLPSPLRSTPIQKEVL